MQTLEAIISQAWSQKDSLTPETTGPFRDAILECMDLLGSGKARVASKKEGKWVVHQWLKQAVLLSFRIEENTVIDGQIKAFDKVPLKFDDWDQAQFDDSGIRVVPGSVVRRGAYLGPNVVVMPSFVNIGAYVGEGTMVDSGCTVGSCAQIGNNCHLSSNTLVGGVLEPLQAAPTIFEDNCFLGAGSCVTEGMIVEEGAVISSGMHITASTPIMNRETGDMTYGRIPAYSVVVPGTRTTESGGGVSLSLACAVIVKQVTSETRAKTEINELLRA